MKEDADHLHLKKPNSSTLEHFRLISLCTTLYKVYARILVKWLKLIILHLIRLEQGAFVSGHCIIDSILLTKEFMHDMWHAPIHQSLMAIKLDIDLAYD